MPRLLPYLLTCSLVVLATSCFGVFGQVEFPAPGDEAWELVSEIGATRHWASDRCCSFDGRNRLYVCNTGPAGDGRFPHLRRWDGHSWENIEHSEAIWSVCSGPENIVLLGEDVNLGYIRDSEYHEIEMGYWYSDWQATTCFEDDTWVLSYGADDGLQRTNWREGGGDWISMPGYGLLSEIDAWRGDGRWACSEGKVYFQDLRIGDDWALLAFNGSY